MFAQQWHFFAVSRFRPNIIPNALTTILKYANVASEAAGCGFSTMWSCKRLRSISRQQVQQSIPCLTRDISMPPVDKAAERRARNRLQQHRRWFDQKAKYLQALKTAAKLRNEQLLLLKERARLLASLAAIYRKHPEAHAHILKHAPVEPDGDGGLCEVRGIRARYPTPNPDAGPALPHAGGRTAGKGDRPAKKHRQGATKLSGNRRRKGGGASART